MAIIIAVSVSGYILKEELKPKEPLRIAISNWIGYMPIVYAKEKGWVDDSDIELVWTASLEITGNAYDRGLVDAMFATQYDYFRQTKEIDSQMLFATNLSDEADMVLSNTNIDDLRNSKNIILNLELNSLGETMFDSFIKQYRLNKDNFLIFDRSQLGITEYDYSNKKAVAIVYPPYDSILKTKGFCELTNAKKLHLDVIDGLFVRSDTANSNQEVLIKIKSAFLKALDEADKNPYDFYTVVKPYIGNISYTDFKTAIDGIAWANRTNIAKIDEIAKKQHIKQFKQNR